MVGSESHRRPDAAIIHFVAARPSMARLASFSTRLAAVRLGDRKPDALHCHEPREHSETVLHDHPREPEVRLAAPLRDRELRGHGYRGEGYEREMHAALTRHLRVHQQQEDGARDERKLRE